MAAPTESSRFWTTGGAGDGASTYTRDQLAEAFRSLLAAPTTQGVLIGLAVSGVASPMTLAIGAALVYGFWYFCTVAGDLTLATPVVGTTGFRIVLRAGWTAQTVRAVVIPNTDGVAGIPAVTQNAGTTWEITLATGTITTGGVITLTDARDFVPGGPSAAALSVLGRSANTAGVIEEIVAANDGEVLRRSGTAIGFGTVPAAGLATGAVTAGKIADGGVDTTARLADSIVTAAKIADRARKFMAALIGSRNTTSAAALLGVDGGGLEMPDGVTSEVIGSFIMPSDLASGLTVKAIIQSAGAGNTRASGRAWGGLATEALNANELLQAATDVAVTGGIITVAWTLNLSSDTFLAGDIVHLGYTRSGAHANDTISGQVFFLGFLVEYTADS